MNNLEKRLNQVEKRLKTKYNHHGAFIILTNDGGYEILNKEVPQKYFDSYEVLQKYIDSKYDCEKYVYIVIDKNYTTKNTSSILP